MNKEIKSRVELVILNAKHVCNNPVYTTASPMPAGADIIYLLEKIEELQSQIDELKIKNEINRTIKHKKIK